MTPAPALDLPQPVHPAWNSAHRAPGTAVRAPRQSASAAGAVRLRGAEPGDVAGIAALVNGFAAEGRMLPRTPESIALAIDDYVVAVDERGRVLACGALREYSPSLAEVCSVAVARSARGLGLGKRIVQAVEALARARGVGELFALTLEPEFFKTLGYAVTERERYPEKVRQDCLGCARRAYCAEICVRRVLPLEQARTV